MVAVMKLEMTKTARGLNLPVSKLERWIRQGRIPIQKKGDICVFNKSLLDEWAEKHHLSFSLDKPSDPINPGETEPDSLVTAMKRGGVLYDLPGTDAKAVLESAVSGIPDLNGPAKEELHKRLLERENMTSTGIGKGVAVPHPRTPMDDLGETPRITTCFPAAPVDFEAIDKLPVFVMFILLCPSVKTHLHLLSRLAYFVRDDAFVGFLKSVPKSDIFFQTIADFEKRLDSSE